MSRIQLGYLLAFASAAAGAVRFNLAVFANIRFEVPYEILLFLALVAGVTLSGIHVAVRDGAQGFVPLRGHWKPALLYGVLMAWGTLSHFIALRFLNETVMSSLSQTNILLTIALAVWVLKERFTRVEWWATLVICAGVLAFRPWHGIRFQGLLIVMSGALGAAVATIVAKRGVETVAPRILMFWRNAIALVVVGIYAHATIGRTSLSAGVVGVAVAIGLVGPYLHGLFFLQALERVDAAKAALLNRVQPAIVFAISFLFLGRRPSAADLVSAAFVVAGTVWLAAARPRPEGRPPPPAREGDQNP